jgi:hypothetical protein
VSERGDAGFGWHDDVHADVRQAGLAGGHGFVDRGLVDPYVVTDGESCSSEADARPAAVRLSPL